MRRLLVPLSACLLVSWSLLSHAQPPAIDQVTIRFADGSQQTLVAPATVPTTAQSTTALALSPTFAALFAPAAVHVAVPNLEQEPDPLNTRYQWDFGDPDSPHNRLQGFNAAHVYDRPGLYTLTLTRTTPDGAATVATATVQVRPELRRTVYIAADGDDANLGLSPQRPVRTFPRLAKLLANNTNVLFRRGDTFPTATTLWLSYSNLVIGTYGEGEKPLIQWTSADPDTAIFAVDRKSRDVLVQDLAFDTPGAADHTNEKGLPFALYCLGGQNLALRNCRFLNVGYVVQGNGAPKGVLLQGNAAPLITGLRGYFAWVEGSDYVILGNTVANSTRQHIVRMTRTSRVLIADNDFTNADRRAVDKDDYSKSTLAIHDNQWVCVMHNHLQDGPLRTGPLATPGAADTVERTGVPNKQLRSSNVLVCDNVLSNTWVEMLHGSHNVLVRDNLVRNTNLKAFVVDGFNSEFDRQPEKIVIDHNTVIESGTTGLFLMAGHAPGAITLTHNLYLAPKLEVGSGGAIVWVWDKDLSSFAAIRGNHWPSPRCLPAVSGGHFYVAPKLQESGGYQTPEQWRELGGKDDEYDNVAFNEQTACPAPDSAAARGGAGRRATLQSDE